MYMYIFHILAVGHQKFVASTERTEPTVGSLDSEARPSTQQPTSSKVERQPKAKPKDEMDTKLQDFLAVSKERNTFLCTCFMCMVKPRLNTTSRNKTSFPSTKAYRLGAIFFQD